MAKREREKVVRKRSEIVTVRLDPKLKYLAELAARKHRRALSSYIEWAVEVSLSQVVLGEHNHKGITVADAERVHRLWDLDEPDRLVRLAMTFPELMTYEEQTIWKLLRENGYLWKGNFHGSPPQWTWKVEKDAIRWDRLRKTWPVFQAVAKGTSPMSSLPNSPIVPSPQLL